MHFARDSHWTLVKRILRYIRGTMSLGLTLTASASTDLVTYSDADWVGPDILVFQATAHRLPLECQG